MLIEKDFKFNVVGERGVPKLRKFKHIGLASGILLATLGVASTTGTASADEVASSTTDTSSTFVLDQSAPSTSTESVTTGTPTVSTPEVVTPVAGNSVETAKSDASVAVEAPSTTGSITPSVAESATASAVVDEGMHATNLADAQGEASKDATSVKEKAGTTDGVLRSDVVDETLNKAIKTATSEGVNLTDKGKVTYKTLEEAKSALASQAKALDEVTAKKKANTTAVSKAVDENKAIDAENKDEADRVAKFNADGLEAMKLKNAQGQAEVDKYNAEQRALVDSENQQGQAEVDKFNAEQKASADKANADSAEKARLENESRQVDYANKLKEIEDVIKYNEGVRQRNADNLAAIEKRNKDAKDAYDKALNEYNDKLARSSKTTSDNSSAKEQYEAELAKYNSAKAELDKKKAEYEANLAKYNEALKDYESKVVDYQSKNADYLAKMAEYKAKLAELESKKTQEGYAKEVLSQSLDLNAREPQAVIVNQSSQPSRVIQKGDSSLGGYNKILGSSNYLVYDNFATNQTLSFDYTNLTHSKFNGKSISSVHYDITNIQSPLGATSVKLVVPNDPTEGFIAYREDGNGNWRQDRMEFKVTARYTLSDGSVAKFTPETPAVFTHYSLNHNDIGLEYVKDSSGKLVGINGSTIEYQASEGLARSGGSNRPEHIGLNEEWDTSSSRYVYKGAILSNATSGDSYTVTFGQGDMPKEVGGKTYWFALNTLPVTPVVPNVPTDNRVPEPVKPEAPSKPDLTPLTPPAQPNFVPVDNVPEKPVEPTPESFTPEKEKEVPSTPNKPDTVNPTVVTPTTKTFTPKEFTPKTFTPDTFTPKTPKVKPHVDVPEVVNLSADYRGAVVEQSPSIVKDVVNGDGVSVNGQLVVKGQEKTWVLTNGVLKAGRDDVTTLEISDPLPAGFEVSHERLVADNKGFDVSVTETGSTVLRANAETLALLNADKSKEVTIPNIVVTGRPLNDGATYENTYEMKVITPSGTFTTHSNTPVIYTSGRDPKKPRPKDPNGNPPVPHDNFIKPVKSVLDDKGNDINGSSVLPNTTLNYNLHLDYDQYKGVVATKSEVANGFAGIDSHTVGAFSNVELVKATAENGDDVTSMFESINVLSNEARTEVVNKILANAGYEPKGDFHIYKVKDSQAFYDKYVSKGISVNLSLKASIAEAFAKANDGKSIDNSIAQIDFGNGYTGNTVTNKVTLPKNHKSLVDSKGKAITEAETKDGSSVSIGDMVTYKLEGWTVPSGRGYDLTSYTFNDDTDESHDEYQGFMAIARTDIKLTDGSTIAKGSDLSKYAKDSYSKSTGVFKLDFDKDFLAKVSRDSEFGADVSLRVKRIAEGTVVNEYTLDVNGNPVISNKVITKTIVPPAPDKPKEPKTPTPETPKPDVPVKEVPKSPTPEAPTPVASTPDSPTPVNELPNTGESDSSATALVGLATVVGALGLAGVSRKRRVSDKG